VNAIAPLVEWFKEHYDTKDPFHYASGLLITLPKNVVAIRFSRDKLALWAYDVLDLDAKPTKVHVMYSDPDMYDKIKITMSGFDNDEI